MKIFKQIFTLAILAATLAACEKPAQQLPNQPTSLNQPVVDVVADQPVEDVPTGNHRYHRTRTGSRW